MSTKNTSGKSIISYDDGIAVAKIVSAAAKKKGGNVAVCGGLAMHIHGFTRATKDVDVIADMTLGFKEIKTLSFGGVACAIEIESGIIEVDFIIRTDEVKELYEKALVFSRIHKTTGLKVVTPEYLVILKYLAGRGKDQIDLLWMLREDNLVNRNKVKDIVTDQMGKHSYWALRDLENLYLEADLLRARDQRGK